MTLLLKNVWRNVLKSGQLSKTALHMQNFSSMEVSHTRSPDAIMARLRASPSSAEVLAAVQTHLPAMTHRHMLQALRMLFELQRTGKSELDAENVIKDPTFGVLCQNFKKHARSLDANEAIEATKVLSFLSVPVDSLIVQTMLQIIRCNINLLSVRQIMYLDFLLHKFDQKNHLVDALKLALPLAFQIHLPLEIDNQDLLLLKDMLHYCCSHDLPDRCINNVVTGLLLHDQAINAPIAKSIIWSLCDVNCTDEKFSTRVQLLHICFDILVQTIDELSYDDVLRTAAKLKGRILEKHPEYYHEQLMDAIANYTIKKDIEFEKALLIARVLSRIAHTHLGLVEYLCKTATSFPSTLSNARTNILFSFVNCLSNSNYTPDPDTWDELRHQISENPVLNANTLALPWTKLCLELASLGHYEDKLLSKIFSEEFLQEYLNRNENFLDYIQLLTLHEAVNTFYSDRFKLPPEVADKARGMYPSHPLSGQLQEALSRGLGGPHLAARNVVLPNGIVADVLLCLKGGYPVQLPQTITERTPIDQLNLPQDGLVVCIMNFNQGCFSMNSNRLRGTFRLILDILEKQGYIAVPVNVQDWLNAPGHERTPYLIREISYKCGEVGMKLCAT